MKTILHLCASRFGSDVRDYLAHPEEYKVISITKDIGVENYNPPKGVYGIIANPPCTMFSRARTTAKTPRDLNEGMRLVKECLRIIWEAEAQSHLAFWALENPATGLLKNFLGKPAFIYNPHEYGDILSKRTALWGCFNEPKKPIVSKNEEKVIIGGESGWWRKLKARAENEYGTIKGGGHEMETDVKSIACPAFTKAFFEANR